MSKRDLQKQNAWFTVTGRRILYATNSTRYRNQLIETMLRFASEKRNHHSQTTLFRSLSPQRSSVNLQRGARVVHPFTERKKENQGWKGLLKQTKGSQNGQFKTRLLQTQRESRKYTRTDQNVSTEEQYEVTLDLPTGERKAIKTNASTICELNEQLIRQASLSNVVGFATTGNILKIDYYLTIPSAATKGLLERGLELKPIYSEKQPDVTIRSFQIVKCIGTGGFSKVYLVRFKEDGRFYAMKIIDKLFIIKNKKKRIVMNERNIMTAIDHPFLVKMKWAFESQYSLVFVMEYYPGGELFGLVRRYRRMSEQIARFYVTEILMGLQHIHQKGVIYRDFKPENIMIDREGHVHIADFGLAKPNITSKDRAYSFCGSPEYMPPEMIMKQGHGPAVDFYCIGALLYELVTGLPPFYDRNIENIYKAAVEQPLTFPKNVTLSKQIKDLLTKMLKKDDSVRLGTDGGVEQVFEHPWFRTVIKSQYLKMEMVSPVSFKMLDQLSFNQEEMGTNDKRYLAEVLSQQREERVGNFSQVMENFYFDGRQLATKASEGRPTLFRKCAKNGQTKRPSRQSLSLSKVFTNLSNII